MGHVVLLGDSIFDNAAYVGGGLAVIEQVRERLPKGWRASLLAIDGDVTRGVVAQAARVPNDATHLVVSVGGNDALGQSHILGASARSVAEALTLVADAAAAFERDYRRMMEAVLSRSVPAAFCTIYNPRFPEPEQRLAVTALCVFNDAVLRAAFAEGAPVIDPRQVCNEDADYANPIEPSSRGGAKIADAIARLVARHDFSAGRSTVFV